MRSRSHIDRGAFANRKFVIDNDFYPTAKPKPKMEYSSVSLNGYKYYVDIKLEQKVRNIASLLYNIQIDMI